MVTRCDSSDKRCLEKLLTDATAAGALGRYSYVPFALARQNRTLYVKQFQRHNAALASTKALKLFGIDDRLLHKSTTYNGMTMTIQHILNTAAAPAVADEAGSSADFDVFYSVEQTPSTHHDGKYALLFDHGRSALLEEWVDELLAPTYAETVLDYTSKDGDDAVPDGFKQICRRLGVDYSSFAAEYSRCSPVAGFSDSSCFNRLPVSAQKRKVNIIFQEFGLPLQATNSNKKSKSKLLSAYHK